MESAKQPSIFKKVDSYLFEHIDNFKSSSAYIKFVELLNSMPRDNRLVLNQAVTFFLISFPIIVLLIVFISNRNLKNSLETKKEILRLSGDILSQQRDLHDIKRKVLTFPAIKNQSDLDSKVRASLTKAGINPNYIRVENFSLDSSSPTIFRSTADVDFSKLSINQFVDLISYLIRYEKVKIYSLSINKDMSDGLLKGKFQLFIFGEERSESE